MLTYDPFKTPDKDQWLEFDELERLDAIAEYHEAIEHELEEDALYLHNTIHLIVENQLVEGVELLPETTAKLIRQGLDRHDAIHAIGAILVEDIIKILRGELDNFDLKKYRRRLQKLTAKRWNKGQY